MEIVLSLLPAVIVVGLLATRRAGILGAGLIGLAASLPAVVTLRGTEGLAEFLWTESLRGGWIAWHANIILFAGVLFYQVLQRNPPVESPFAAKEDPHRAAFTAAILIGPFTESAIGFGVGAIIAAAALVRTGLKGHATAGLALFSHMLVPWGALGVSTIIVAGIAGIRPEELGRHSAVLAAITLPLLLPVLWLMLRAAGIRLTPRNMGIDLAAMLSLSAMLLAVNWWMAFELGGLLPTGVLLLLAAAPRFLREPAAIGPVLRAIWPYALLTGALLASRLAPGLPEQLKSVLHYRPYGEINSYAVLYHPSFWLLVSALAAAPQALGRADILPTLRDSLRMAWIPLIVTLTFLVLAQWLMASGAATVLGNAWQALAGAAAILAMPLFAGFISAPTASSTAANAILMPVSSVLAAATGMPLVAVATAQNVAGGMCTMLAPVRVALSAGLFGLQGEESRVYRHLGLVAPVVLGVPALYLAWVLWL
jgi:lactate permease